MLASKIKTVLAKMCSFCMLNKCRLETVAERGHMGADPVLPDSVKPMAADSTEDLNSQGFDLALIRSSNGNGLFPSLPTYSYHHILLY